MTARKPPDKHVIATVPKFCPECAAAFKTLSDCIELTSRSTVSWHCRCQSCGWSGLIYPQPVPEKTGEESV
jgi:hypothetical protein